MIPRSRWVLAPFMRNPRQQHRRYYHAAGDALFTYLAKDDVIAVPGGNTGAAAGFASNGRAWPTSGAEGAHRRPWRSVGRYPDTPLDVSETSYAAAHKHYGLLVSSNEAFA